MKRFLYLVHGEDKLIENYLFLRDSKTADLLMSTYNKKADGAFFFPESTWAEGRNMLLEKALELENEYDYYIFLDDDICFHSGSYELFEEQLNKHNPAVAIPVFVPKTVLSILALGLSFNHRFFFPVKDYQVCHFADGQFMAFHKDVISDRILLPLQNQFDRISWWYTSSTQQILMHHFYRNRVLQFNNVAVTNESHREYTKESYEEHQEQWLREQFKVPVYNPRPYALNLLTLQGIRSYFRFYKLSNIFNVIKIFSSALAGTITYRREDNHRLSGDEVKAHLKPGSELYNQYLSKEKFLKSV